MGYSNVADMTEELNCFHILLNLNLNSHMWLVAVLADSSALDYENKYLNLSALTCHQWNIKVFDV